MLTQDDLLFSLKEAELLAAGRKCGLTRRQIRDLLGATGGWAMYLSAILSDGRTDGAPPSLSQYLETRVWNGWDDGTRRILAMLAIPEALTPELCERLTGRDGRGVLKTLTKEKNVFLSRVDADRYRFHDVFREFLLSRAGELGEDELRRLNSIAAEWHFEQGDYFASIAHFIKNRDQEGISRCIAMTFQLQEEENNLSVDLHYHSACQYVMKLPDEFVAENPYLLLRRTISAFHGGNVEAFTRDLDLLYRMRPETAGTYPDLAVIYRFLGALDMRMPLRDHIRAVATAHSPASSAAARKSINGLGPVTRNLPFYHRSMRDFSEYHELRDEDLALFQDALGVFMGGNNAIYEQCLMAGIHYEKGDVLRALHHALNAQSRHADLECAGKGRASPEAFLSANVIVAQALYALGAAGEAKRVLERAEAHLNENGRFLIPNLKAVQAEHAARAGDIDAAQEWLAVYASRSEHLLFYQMPQHFATLRSYVAMEYYASAIRLGGRLRELAAAYQRPLDQTECCILLAIAMQSAGKREDALKMMNKAVHLALPCGFVQLFLNEGRGILPLLLALRDKRAGAAGFHGFVERLCGEISGCGRAEKDEAPPRLSAMRRRILRCLEKGMSYREIAGEAGIAHGTAKRHALLLYKQLGVHSAEDAVAKAKMLGIA